MSERPRLLVATTNPGKLAEFRQLLRPLDVSLDPLPAGAPAVDETGATYRENAELKARQIAAWSGRPALADDSGLEVDALHGAPGVLSARYAGPDSGDAANTRKLLTALSGVPPSARGARFRCVIAVARADGELLVVEGTCEGFIVEEPRGTGGFGYDPVFLYPPSSQTFAELAAMTKNAVSHRAAACAALLPLLEDFLAGRSSS